MGSIGDGQKGGKEEFSDLLIGGPRLMPCSGETDLTRIYIPRLKTLFGGNSASPYVHRQDRLLKLLSQTTLTNTSPEV